MWALVSPDLWIATGFLYWWLFLAHENLPYSFYEGARLDGATPTRLFFSGHAPLMWERAHHRDHLF